MMAASPDGGEFRHQDGIVLTRPGKGKRPHPQFRLENRARGEWANANVRALWREAVPIPSHSSGESIVRYHEQSDLLLIAAHGCLQTVVPLWWRSDAEQRQVRAEAEAMRE